VIVVGFKSLRHGPTSCAIALASVLNFDMRAEHNLMRG
jgi:hypothetical protein